MPLAFELGADLTKFDRAMDKAKETVAKRGAEMVQLMTDAGKGMDGAILNGLGGQAFARGLPVLLRYAPAIAAITAAFGALAAIGLTAANQLARVEEIASGSKAAGVSGTFWQTWTNELERVGIEAEEAGRALTKAREAVKLQATDTGQLADNRILDILGEQALGPGRLQGVYAQFKDAQDTEARIKAVVQAIRDLNAAAQETGDSRLNLLGNKLSELTFGSDKFAEAIRKAKDNFEALEAAGVNSGAVFSNEIVARAQQLNERLNEATRQLRDDLHPIMEGLAGLGLSFKEAWVGIVQAIADAVHWAAQIHFPEAPAWVQNLQRLAGLGSANGNPYSELPMTPGQTGVAGAAIAGAPAWAGGLVPVNGAGPAGSPVANPLTITPPRRPPPSVFKTRDDVAQAAPGASFDEVDNYLKQLEKTVDVLKAQVSVLGLGNAERTKAVDLARAEAAARERGTALTEEERHKVLQLADAEAQARKALEDFKKAQQAVAEATNFFGNQVIDVFDQMVFQGAKAEDVMRSLASTMVKTALQATLLGSGPLAGLFGTQGQNGAAGGVFGALGQALASSFNFGGARAMGGPVVSGKTYLVGENGPEMVRFGANGSVTPNALAAMSGPGGSGAPIVNVHNYGGAQIETTQSNGPGGPQLDVIVRNIVLKDLDQRGPMARQFEKFGMRR